MPPKPAPMTMASNFESVVSPAGMWTSKRNCFGADPTGRGWRRPAAGKEGATRRDGVSSDWLAGTAGRSGPHARCSSAIKPRSTRSW